MATKTIQLMIASDNPEIQNLLGDALKQEVDTTIVGRAQNAVKAMALAKKLRPDVAVIDSYLPYRIGWEANPQSRISGLDTARIISEEVPDTKVVLVNNLDSNALLNGSVGAPYPEIYFMRGMCKRVSFGLNELSNEVPPSNGPVFASIILKPQTVDNEVVMTMSDKIVLVGIAEIVVGVGSIVTVMFAPVGVALALVGAATVMFGLVWRKIKNRISQTKSIGSTSPLL